MRGRFMDAQFFYSTFQYMEIFSYKNTHGKPYKYSGKLTGEHTSKVLANSHDVSSALPCIHNIDAYHIFATPDFFRALKFKLPLIWNRRMQIIKSFDIVLSVL
jgi:hypothetical protein